MTTREHEDHVDSVGAYALGALPALEAQVFERHLMACESCQEELQRLSEAADALPRSVNPYPAPPELKENLMATVRAEAARSRPARARSRRARRSWRPELRPVFAAAAAAFVVGLAVFAVTRDSNESRTVAARVDQARVPAADADLSIPEGGGDAVLNVRGLPDPGRGRVYQVWVKRGQDVAPVSIFSVNSRGAGAAAVPGSLEGVDAVMVTREKRGGARAPTEPPLLSVRV